jgi:hypothetical protein
VRTFGFDPAGASAADLFRHNEPRGFEHRKVLHHAWQRHRQRRGKFAYRRWALDQAIDHGAAARVGEGLKGQVQMGFGSEHNT